MRFGRSRNSSNTSGLTCIKPISQFRPSSRNTFSLSFGCGDQKNSKHFRGNFKLLNLLRSYYFLTHFQVTYSLSLKTVTNWRQLINLPAFEYCPSRIRQSSFF